MFFATILLHKIDLVLFLICLQILFQEESRGLADPEGAKKRRLQKEEAERKAAELEEQGGGENKLAVSCGFHVFHKWIEINR